MPQALHDALCFVGKRRHVRHRFLTQAILAAGLAMAGHGYAQSPPATTVKKVDDALVFSGRISPQSVAQFLQLLQDPAITRLVITSNGGIVSAALDMALAIHERQLDVEVPTECWSSCANYVFPAARRKAVGRPGAVAWHGNMAHVLYLHQTGQASWNAQEMEVARDLARREAQFFSRIGVDGFLCWFAKIGPYNVDGFYFLSADDLAQFGVRQVTVRNDATPPAPQGEAPRHVRVNWDALERDRPVVPLDR